MVYPSSHVYFILLSLKPYNLKKPKRRPEIVNRQIVIEVIVLSLFDNRYVPVHYG